MGGFPKENKQKKNVLCENSVEVWGNDGSTHSHFISGQKLEPKLNNFGSATLVKKGSYINYRSHILFESRAVDPDPLSFSLLDPDPGG